MINRGETCGGIFVHSSIVELFFVSLCVCGGGNPPRDKEEESGEKENGWHQWEKKMIANIEPRTLDISSRIYLQNGH